MQFESELLNRKQAAAALNVSERTLSRLQAAGKLPAPIALGERLRRWRKCDIAAWIAGRDRSESA